MAEIGEMVKAQSEYLKTHTVLQTLLNMNSDAKVAQNIGFYYLEARYGEPGDYAGPDLLAEWYRRNVRIFNNVTKLVAAPARTLAVVEDDRRGERILKIPRRFRVLEVIIVPSQRVCDIGRRLRVSGEARGPARPERRVSSGGQPLHRAWFAARGRH